MTSGAISLKVQFLGIQVVSETKDLCETVGKAGQQCPLSGDLSLKVTESLPSSAPSGSYTGRALITDQNGAQLTCVDLKFNLQ